eukprot:m.292401 g.292401  ORF g.292401 m.292401 type:complete len:523 (+) comp12622_c0_seq1:635-2203(+)
MSLAVCRGAMHRSQPAADDEDVDNALVLVSDLQAAPFLPPIAPRSPLVPQDSPRCSPRRSRASLSPALGAPTSPVPAAAGALRRSSHRRSQQRTRSLPAGLAVSELAEAALRHNTQSRFVSTGSPGAGRTSPREHGHRSRGMRPKGARQRPLLVPLERQSVASEATTFLELVKQLSLSFLDLRPLEDFAQRRQDECDLCEDIRVGSSYLSFGEGDAEGLCVLCRRPIMGTFAELRKFWKRFRGVDVTDWIQVRQALLKPSDSGFTRSASETAIARWAERSLSLSSDGGDSIPEQPVFASEPSSEQSSPERPVRRHSRAAEAAREKSFSRRCMSVPAIDTEDAPSVGAPSLVRCRFARGLSALPRFFRLDHAQAERYTAKFHKLSAASPISIGDAYFAMDELFANRHISQSEKDFVIRICEAIFDDFVAFFTAPEQFVVAMTLLARITQMPKFVRARCAELPFEHVLRSAVRIVKAFSDRGCDVIPANDLFEMLEFDDQESLQREFASVDIVSALVIVGFVKL